jgi:hypothetical protein
MEFDPDNIFPNNIERIFFYRLDPITKSLKTQASRICRNRISEQYINSVFKKFDFGYWYKDVNNNSIGFCIWKEKNELSKEIGSYNYINILLICADQYDLKLGKMMFCDIDTYCKNKNMRLIQLEAANLKLAEVYKDYGFTLERVNPPLIMSKDVDPTMLICRSKHNATRKKTREPLINKDINIQITTQPIRQTRTRRKKREPFLTIENIKSINTNPPPLQSVH